MEMPDNSSLEHIYRAATACARLQLTNEHEQKAHTVGTPPPPKVSLAIKNAAFCYTRGPCPTI